MPAAPFVQWIDAFFGPDPVLARAAGAALAAQPDPPAAIEAVIPLNGPGRSLRPGTELRLARLANRLGPSIVGHLARCIGDGDWNAKLLAATCFAGLETSHAVQAPLVALLEKAGDFDSERLALEALGRNAADVWSWRIEHHARTGQWERAPHERGDHVSDYAYGKLSSYGLQALARCAAKARDPDRVGSLLRTVDEFLRQRRALLPNVAPDGYALLRSVGREFSERTVDPMIALWGRHAEPALQKLCMSLLCDIAPLRAAGFLLDAATNPLLDTDVRGMAAVALGEIRTPSIATRVAEAMCERAADAAPLDWPMSTLYAVGGDWSAVAPLRDSLLDQHTEVGVQLRYGMAVRGEARCRDPLLRGLDHKDSFIRWTSALALARLLGPAGLAHLKHRAEEAADDLERSAILAASIRAGQTECVDALQESLQKTGQLPQLRSIWKAEILDALRLGRPVQPELFDAWQEEALLSERSLRYFQEWGQAATSVPVSVVATAALTAPASTSPAPPARVFVSYSSKDAVWLKRFQTMLAPLQNKQRLDVWDDSRIVPGKWRPQIDAAMRNARVALFLVSDNLLGSEFVTQNEMPELLRMAEERGLRVVWVLLKPCFWEECGLHSYQGVNAKRPLSGLKAAERDKIVHAACKTVLEAAG